MSSSSATVTTAFPSRSFDRWLIPPAALAVHLSIGQLYAFSVFNEPLTRAIGITAPAPGDSWLTDLGWIFSLAIVTLGLTALMSTFKSDVSVGVAETFVVMGCIYAIAIAAGAPVIRLPAAGWKPEGWVALPDRAQQGDISPSVALRTKAFWLLWLVLCLNVAAGIGVLGQASVLIQETFNQLTQIRFTAMWASVCLPLAWGIYQTVLKAAALFN